MSNIGKLYSVYQRYNFESNLQQSHISPNDSESCIRYIKDTILKAIYNVLVSSPTRVRAVFDMSKI